VDTRGFPDEEHVEIIDARLQLHLHRVIARGGMGIIYEADLVGCDGYSKRVAVKTLRKKWNENQRFVDLLVAEAKLVSDLVHENIVQMYWLGQLPSGRHYMVMEYVEGVSLYELLYDHWRKRKLLPQPIAIHIVSRIARGLGYAHSMQNARGELLRIVHRDVCPSNVLITSEGLSKLIDFGVAKAETMTIIGDDWQTGKVAYMAPEQARREAVDFRSDIFAMGAVLFEMITGRPMRHIEGKDIPKGFENQPIPWTYLEERADKDIQAIVTRMVAPDPADRFQDTNSVAQALEEYIYRDGYGPTIQTVETYLRNEFPSLYVFPKGRLGHRVPDHPTVTQMDGRQ